MEWISVKDRLPEIEQEVLAYGELVDGDKKVYPYMAVCHIYSITKYATFQNIEWRYGGNDGITHWMPLPPKPIETTNK
jgi:hypothetical protein